MKFAKEPKPKSKQNKTHPRKRSFLTSVCSNRLEPYSPAVVAILAK